MASSASAAPVFTDLTNLKDAPLSILEDLLRDPKGFTEQHGIETTPEVIDALTDAKEEILSTVVELSSQNPYLTVDDRNRFDESEVNLSDVRVSASLVETVALALAAVAAARKAVKK